MVAGLTYAGNNTLTECIRVRVRHEKGSDSEMREKGLNGVAARKLTESYGS